MITNVGTFDRALRAVLGLALIAWAILGWPIAEYKVVGWLGAIPLLTAIFGTCPLYSLLGINTCELGKSS